LDAPEGQVPANHGWNGKHRPNKAKNQREAQNPERKAPGRKG
jgi:hypothetical protein